MDKQQLKQTLHELATQAVPSNLDLWPALRDRLAPQPQQRLRARPIPTPRWSWVGLTLMAVFALSIAAYAAGPLMSRLLQKDERLTHVNLALSQPLDVSQTIENVTVTVQWAYADADYVLVGYTIRASDGRRFEQYHENLSDAAGGGAPWQGTYGLSGQSDLLQETLPPGEGVFVSIFENVFARDTLALRFTVYAQEFTPPTVQATPFSTEGGAAQVQLQPIPAGVVIGPFTFDFTLPVSSADQLR